MLREIIAAAEANGEDPDRVAHVLLEFVSDHPLLGKFDRFSVLDGTRSSARVLDDVRRCLGVLEPAIR